jgi:hypothetical protein
MFSLFNAQRTSLINTVIGLPVDNTLDTLLYGDSDVSNGKNYQLLEAVQYTLDTKGFKKSTNLL